MRLNIINVSAELSDQQIADAEGAVIAAQNALDAAHATSAKTQVAVAP